MDLAKKIAGNVWDHIEDFLKVYERSKSGDWKWYANSKCKYVELRVDMRSGHCIIRDRDGNRVDPKDLEHQIRDNRTEV